MLLIDHAARGSWNMAMDQAILEWVDYHPQIVLRFYQWNPATLSLGYFQRHADRSLHSSSAELDLVRRASGGGAIVHDQELTYSLFVPVAQRLSQSHRDYYDLVHQVFIDLLAEMGVQTQLYVGESAGEAQKSFLCFERRSPGDLILSGFKVGGSAQRRSRQTILQHGSLLLRQSSAAPELPGILELSGATVDYLGFATQVAEAIGERMQVNFSRGDTPVEIVDATKRIEIEKFSNLAWNQNR
ncbi:MAG: biotin/lipoate A/B protein ligase family protein [Pirellulaceae bacterium]